MSNPLIMGRVPLATSPYPEAVLEPTQSCLVGTKDAPTTQEIPRDLDAVITQEITKVSGALRQEAGIRPNIVTNGSPSALYLQGHPEQSYMLCARKQRAEVKYVFLIIFQDHRS